MTETRSKYNAIITAIDGIKFASRAEARRYQELKLAERAGEISLLSLQPKFELTVNNVHVCNYVADFRYVEVDTGKIFIEDVKGMKTQVYTEETKGSSRTRRRSTTAR